MATLTRNQIIDLINQYIYTNGQQRITGAQLQQILLEIANAFAMNGSAGAGIDAVLEAGSSVSDGREIINEHGGSVKLSAEFSMEGFLYEYLGLHMETPGAEAASYTSLPSSTMANLKRSDPSQNFFNMYNKTILGPGEVLSTLATIAQGAREDDAARSSESNDGVISIVISENGRNTHSVKTDRITSYVRVEDTSVGSSQEQLVNSIKSTVYSGPQSSSHTQTHESIQSRVYDEYGSNEFRSTMNLESQVWSDQNSDIFTVFGSGIRLYDSKKLSLSPAGSKPTAGLATLVSGTVTVVTSAVQSNSIISLTVQEGGTYAGNIRVSAKMSSMSFTISSTVSTDNCKVFWQIIDL